MIAKPTAFLLCTTCGEHGHFIFSDRSNGPEFNSKEEVGVELARFRAENLISRGEQAYMADRIGGIRSLADTPEEAGGFIQLICFVEGLSSGRTKKAPDQVPDGPSRMVH